VWLAADLAFGICALARPQLALGFLLATLPLFAHRAPSPWRLHFVLLVLLFELAYLCRLKRPWKGAVEAVRGNPILLLGALYVAASLLSLSSLTPFALIEKHIYLLRILPLDALPNHLATTLNLPERSREYAALSAFLTLQAFLFCLIVWREMTRDPRAGVRFAVALVAGVLVWSGVGLAEFFGTVRLDAIRGIHAFQFLDNPLAPRLQSVSGNSGWFAQYLVLAMPYVTVFLVQQVSRPVRWVTVGLAVAMVQFVIVLTFQRGGWVASAAELCCLATGGVILAWRRTSRGGVPMKAAVAKTLALLAIIIAIMASLLYLSARVGFHPGPNSALARYAGRLQSLTRSPERVQYASAAFDIGKLYPILGGGSESFGLRYREQFLDPTGWYFDVQPKIDPTSAHNVYLQTFAGKGVVGLALLAAMCVCALWASIRMLLGGYGTNRPSRLWATMGGVSTVGFLVYGVVQEVFYVHALQVLFFFSVGVVAAATRGVLTWPGAVRRTLWVLLAGAFVLHLGYEYVYPGPARLVRAPAVSQGLYSQERDENGVLFRWTSSRAVFPVPEGATVFTLQIKSLAPSKQAVTVLMQGVPYGSYSLEDDEWHRLRFLLPAPDGADRSPPVEVRVTPTFESGGRTLGVMVTGVEFR
jgi:hypothetical protein